MLVYLILMAQTLSMNPESSKLIFSNFCLLAQSVIKSEKVASQKVIGIMTCNCHILYISTIYYS